MRDGGTSIPPTSRLSAHDPFRDAAARDPLLHPETDRERLAAVLDILRRRRPRRLGATR